MEDRGVVEGQSWQSLKEGSKRSIVKRLDLKKEDNGARGSTFGPR